VRRDNFRMSAKRFLTNDYKDCKLIKLDPHDSHSPFVVAQEGCGPDDPTAKTKLFYLQHDGMWIDEIARSTRPDSEIGDIVFETPNEAIRLLSNLFGKPLVRGLATTEADAEAYVARMQKVTSTEAAYRDFLARYRAAKKRK
jgi:hypothetical protein